MQIFVSTVVSTMVQVVVLLLVPLIWWWATARKRTPFLRWLGWHRPAVEHPGRLVLVSAATVVAFLAMGAFLVPLVSNRTADSQFSGLGWSGLPAVLVYALAQTAFTEESVFRGFLLKRFATRFGLVVGNLVQAVCFGLLHLGLFWMMVNPYAAIGIGAYAGCIGALFGWINERLAGGSLLPSWTMHALVNLAGGLAALFALR